MLRSTPNMSTKPTRAVILTSCKGFLEKTRNRIYSDQRYHDPNQHGDYRGGPYRLAESKYAQALREDMDEEARDSNYGKSVLATPFPVFRGLLFIIYLAIAITQLMMVHS